MKGTRFKDEQIVAALRDAEATSVVAAARKHGVSEFLELQNNPERAPGRICYPHSPD